MYAYVFCVCQHESLIYIHAQSVTVQIKYNIALDVLNVLPPSFYTLNTHSWLNWVDEDD